ncbi:transposase [Actinoallomurus liliacearum]|uniref:transposase n=1 Tax=Actinoallomurus liliacearum TaxID=1080073 RepID=UPI003CD0B819
MATLAVTRRFDLTDVQWARLEPLLPVPARPGRPSKWTKRQLIDGIRWRVRVGAPWRDVPGHVHACGVATAASAHRVPSADTRRGVGAAHRGR